MKKSTITNVAIVAVGVIRYLNRAASRSSLVRSTVLSRTVCRLSEPHRGRYFRPDRGCSSRRGRPRDAPEELGAWLMAFRIVQYLQLWSRRNRRHLPADLTRFLLLHVLVPVVSIIAGFSTQAAFVLQIRMFPPDPWDRYSWIFRHLSNEWWQYLFVALVPVITGLSLALLWLGMRGLTSTTEKRLIRLCSVALLALAIPVADAVLVGLALAGVVALSWAYGPAALQYFGLIEPEPDPNDEGRWNVMYDYLNPTRSMAGYVCRGCGTVIGNQSAFKKCPVCGIKWG